MIVELFQDPRRSTPILNLLQNPVLPGPGLAALIKIDNEKIFTIGTVDQIKSPSHRHEPFFLTTGADHELFFLLNSHDKSEDNRILNKTVKLTNLTATGLCHRKPKTVFR